MNNSVVFRLNYLLGVNKTILEKEFPTEFKESEKLRLFENYPDAKKVRSICRLRQSVLSDFAVYQRKVQDVNAFNGVVGINEDIAYLKSNGIDIKIYYKDLSLFRYFNFLSRMLNAILFKVLVELEMHYIDELIKYFYMPTVSKSELESLVAKSGDSNNPYKVIIYNGDKIRQSLKYALHKDRNCIYSIFSIQGKSFSGEVEIEPFTFSKEMCEDIDPDSVIDLDTIFKEVKAEMVTPNMKPMEIRGLEEYQAQKQEELLKKEEIVASVEEKEGVQRLPETNNEIEIKVEEKTDIIEPVSDKEDSVTVVQDVEENNQKTVDVITEEIKEVAVENIASEEVVEAEEELEIQIDKTIKISVSNFSVEQILQESRFDALTYSVLCSIIKMPLYKITNENFVKSRIREVIEATKLFTEEEIKEYFSTVLCDLRIEITENVVNVILGNYTVCIG